jgi:hypothetical protein
MVSPMEESKLRAATNERAAFYFSQPLREVFAASLLWGHLRTSILQEIKKLLLPVVLMAIKKSYGCTFSLN